MKVKGSVFKYGDNVDTDGIIPARHLLTSDPEVLKNHCMEDIDANFATKVKPGDIIVGGKNFGCGSSREHAPIALKGTGLSCVIAESFARIFYRNSLNIGFPIIESKGASQKIDEGDVLEIDFATGEIKNIRKNEIYKGQAYPEFIQGIIQRGGLVGYIKGKAKED